MDEDRYTALCERIIEHCRRNGWYGPDEPPAGYGGYGYEQGTPRGGRIAHDYRSGFAFSPATDEQLRETEAVMGFAHPPCLRALYLRVANGGFGPTTGLTGAFGGFCASVHKDPRYIGMMKESLLKEHGEQCREWYPHIFNELPFDLVRYEETHRHYRYIRLAPRVWPTHFLHLCNGDYEEAFYLHALSGRVYLVTAGGGITPDGEEGFTVLHRQANSLEEWLERWLDGTLTTLYIRPEYRYKASNID